MLWELATLQEPDLLEQEDDRRGGPVTNRLLSLLEEGKRLRLDSLEPRLAAWAVAAYESCMRAAPADRPSFAQLLEQIAGVVEESAL